MICRGCGYDLSGLRTRGRCPECGEYYDRVTGAGLEDAGGGASARHRRGERVARWLALGALLGLAAIVLACGGAAAWMQEDWWPVVVGGLIALVIALSAANYYLGDRNERSEG